LLEETHRFHYPPYFDGRYLRWNFALIFGEIKSGLRLAATRASELGRSVESIGVDSWAVDYGLVDSDGRLVSDPVCYRDDRTNDAMTSVFTIVSRDEIFERTGIQFQKFNTLYQLMSEGRDADGASMLLLLPDLINYFLTGRASAEYTNATTTQMVNASSGDWDVELLGRLNLPRRLLQPIVPAGRSVGALLPEIAQEADLHGVNVIAPATHDTASAVAAAPLRAGTAFISSGTWSLIGIERSCPLITREVSRLNFTNEGGAYDTFRFLKNVMGLWILESCRKEWDIAATAADYESLIRDAEAIDDFPAFIFPDDERFLNPQNMLDAINTQLSETGHRSESDPAIITKIILDSLAFRYASVLRSIELLDDTELERVEILGGGGRNRYLTQMTANATGLPVRTGLTEATVVGNALVQAIASGRFASHADARSYIASKFEFKDFAPRALPNFAETQARYLAVENRFTGSAARAGDGK
jgi:rhamnulokinase